jgi:hypothetical protein
LGNSENIFGVVERLISLEIYFDFIVFTTGSRFIKLEYKIKKGRRRAGKTIKRVSLTVFNDLR